jgi:hypothetical protein
VFGPVWCATYSVTSIKLSISIGIIQHVGKSQPTQSCHQHAYVLEMVLDEACYGGGELVAVRARKLVEPLAAAREDEGGHHADLVLLRGRPSSEPVVKLMTRTEAMAELPLRFYTCSLRFLSR